METVLASHTEESGCYPDGSREPLKAVLGHNVIRFVFQHQRGAFGWEVEARSGFYGHSGGGQWWPNEGVTAMGLEKGDDL